MAILLVVIVIILAVFWREVAAVLAVGLLVLLVLGLVEAAQLLHLV
jgi:hypothetical protein